MSIVPLKKITICGMSEESIAMTSQLQEAGKMHIIETTSAETETENRYSTTTAQESLKALYYLTSSPNKLHMVQKDKHFDAETLVDKISALREDVNNLNEEKEILEKEIEKLTPWGDFESIPKEDLDCHKTYFYIMHREAVRRIPKGTIYSTIAVVNERAHVIVLAKTKPHGMPVKNIKIGLKPLSKLQDELSEVQEALDNLETERIRLTKYRYLLAHSMNDINNEARRLEVEYCSEKDEQMFIIRGYVGIHDLEEIREIVEDSGLAMFTEEIPEGEQPPTLLENPEPIAGGEEIVKFYSVPGYKSIDPSNSIFFAFALFFAMIMSDFGYALVLGLCVWLLRKKLNQTQAGRRVKVMSYFIVFVSMIWGALVGSYFGVSPHGQNEAARFAQHFKVFDVNNLDVMMKVSIYIGIFHTCFGNLMVAWKYKNTLFALSKIGWTLIIASGFIYIPFIMFKETGSPQTMETAKYMLFGGMGLVVLFTSSSKNIFKRLLGGTIGITNISQAFGDVLSYLRIFALGLSSASLGVTFNSLADGVLDSMPTVGYLVAIIILLAGHSINFGLGIMSGVVHGVRLNVIEFFHWSISDDGYPFNAFKKMEVKKWIHL